MTNSVTLARQIEKPVYVGVIVAGCKGIDDRNTIRGSARRPSPTFSTINLQKIIALGRCKNAKVSCKLSHTVLHQIVPPSSTTKANTTATTLSSDPQFTQVGLCRAAMQKRTTALHRKRQNSNRATVTHWTRVMPKPRHIIRSKKRLVVLRSTSMIMARITVPG